MTLVVESPIHVYELIIYFTQPTNLIVYIYSPPTIIQQRNMQNNQ